MFMTKLMPFFLGLCLTAMIAILPTDAAAQGEDLSLPGDEEEVVVNTGGGGDAAEVGGASQKRGSVLDLALDGGWAMIPLVLMLFAVVALSAYLFLDLKGKTFVPRQLSTSLMTAAEAGDFAGLAQKAQDSPSCLGQVMSGACEYISDRGYEVLDGDSIYDMMADASQEFNRRRVSLLNYLSVISQASPMVGLLGTVSGMIKAFGTLQQAGMGDPGQLAGNISEALVTTASGLIVALPAIFAFFFFRDKLVAQVAAVDKQCAKTLNMLRRTTLGNRGASMPSQAPPAPASPPAQEPVAPAQQPVPPAQSQQPVPPAQHPVPPAQQPVPPAQNPVPPAQDPPQS